MQTQFLKSTTRTLYHGTTKILPHRHTDLLRAREALRQIDDKGYALPFRTEGRRVVKAGVKCNPDNRAVEQWEVAEEQDCFEYLIGMFYKLRGAAAHNLAN